MMQDLSGQKLSQYELRERLGRGGMAEVYKAYQTGMDRFVAIKVMLGQLSDDEEFVERFRREAQSVGRLRHPNIVQVFDFGIENDVYYMAMEFIEGGNLKAFISQKGKVPPIEAIDILLQLVDALDYAHKADMIHRDVKPANIMFVDEKQIILTDFGIAKILSEAGLTTSGAHVGTPAYMSPEAGRGDTVDARADLYALGIILYEMLTGEAPYSADTPLAVVLKHINAPLPTRQDYGHDIPEVLESIIVKAMAKDPNDRYQTAAKMKVVLLDAKTRLEKTADTEHHVEMPVQSTTTEDDQETVIVPPAADTAIPQPTAASSESKRVQTPMMLGGGVLAVLILAVLFALASSDDGNQEVAQSITETSTDMPTDEPVNTPIPTDESPTFSSIMPPHPQNLDILSNLHPLLDDFDSRFVNGDLEQAFADLELAIESESENFDLLFTRSMLQSGTTGYGEESMIFANRLLELAPDNPMTHIALSDAMLHYPQHDPEASREAALRAFELMPDNPEIVWRVARLSPSEERHTLFMDAEAAGAHGYRFIRQMGMYLYEIGEYGRALPYLEVQYGQPYENYDAAEHLMGSFIATQQFDRALEVAQEVALRPSQDVNFGDLAYVAYRAGDVGLAREWAETSRALSPDAQAATWILGLIAWEVDGKPEEALALLEPLLAEEFYPAFQNRRYGHKLSFDLARLYSDLGHVEAALEQYENALSGDADWLPPRFARAQLYIQTGEHDLAREDLRVLLEYNQDPGLRQEILNILRELGPAEGE